jgi:microcystin-dependent protein
MQFAGSTAPDGWLFCDGAILSPTGTYASLFAVIGYTYGQTLPGGGDFYLPDFRGRAPIGVGTGTSLTARALADKVGTETHVLTTAQMPSHTHTYGRRNSVSYSLVNSGSPVNIAGTIPNTETGSAGSGQAHPNMQPSLAVNFIIKY